jgi:hypothetical protein
MQIPFGINSFVFRLLAFPFAIAHRGDASLLFRWSFNEPAAVSQPAGVPGPAAGPGTNPPHRLEPGQKVLLGLVLGVVFGLALHTIYGAGHPVLKATIAWLDLVGNGYVGLLQMIVMPLIFASILSAVARCTMPRRWAASAC